MTTTAIFKDTDDLRRYVRINAQVQPEVWMPGVPAAKQQIASYISAELLDKVESYAKSGTGCKHIATLLPFVQRVMAPMIMLDISAEMSMNISDRGHSVLKDDNSLPASETKIAKYEDSLRSRIDRSLETLLSFLEQNADKYPDYKKSDVYLRRYDCFFRSAKELQDVGLIHIQNSHIAYETLRESIIKAQERYILPKIGKPLYNEIRRDVSNEKQEIKLLASRFCANRAIAQYLEAGHTGTLSFVPADYAGDADFYFEEFDKYLIDHADALGITIYKAPEFNNSEQKLFSAIV